MNMKVYEILVYWSYIHEPLKNTRLADTDAMINNLKLGEQYRVKRREH